MCLIMLKPSKFAKYCELITDFDGLLNDFGEQINRKRSRLQQTPNSVEDENTSSFRLKRSSTVATLAEDEMQRVNKAFYGFFINKLNTLNEKLKSLKTNLSMDLSGSQRSRSTSFFSRALSLNSKRSMQSFDDGSASAKSKFSESSRSSVSYQSDRSQTLKLISSLQVLFFKYLKTFRFLIFILFFFKSTL